MQALASHQGSIGEWIKHRRKGLRSTQAEIAELVGCSVVLIRKIETDERRPSRTIAERLSRALKLAPAETPHFCRAVQSGDPTHLPSPAQPRSQLRSFEHPDILPAHLSLLASPRNPVIIEKLFGREQELATITQKFRSGVRLLSIVGAAGIGKTQLALAAAEHMRSFFRHGVIFIAADALQNEQQLVSILCTLLKLDSIFNDELKALQRYWQQRRMLLILDGCEQQPEIAAFLSELVRTAPQLHVILTSQRLLHLIGEHSLIIQTLSIPPENVHLHAKCIQQYSAIKLFVERASAIQPGFSLEDHIAAVTAIVRQLDGIPLALELAARRLRFYTPQLLRSHMRTDLLAELRDGAYDSPAQHQSWEAALDRSSSSLSAQNQLLFYRLSVFADGWTVTMAEALYQSQDICPVSRGIQQLCDSQLIVVDETSQSEVRFRMPEPMQAYAAKKLREHGEDPDYQLRSTQIMLQIAEQNRDNTVRLQREERNLWAAIRWSAQAQHYTSLAQFGVALYRHWSLCVVTEQATCWIAMVQPWLKQLPEALRAATLLAIGVLETKQERLQEGQAVLEASLELYHQLDQRSGIAEVVSNLGQIAYFRGSYAEAEQYYVEKLQRWQELKCPEYILEALIDLGRLARSRTDFSQAQHYYREALSLAQEQHDYPALARLAAQQGELARQQHLLEAAEAWHLQSLALIERYHLPQDHSSFLALADLALTQGQMKQAYHYAQRCLQHSQKYGQQIFMSSTILLYARIALLCNKSELAIRLSAAGSLLLYSTGAILRHPEHTTILALIEELRQSFTPETFSALWSVAECLPLEEVLSLVEGLAAERSQESAG